MSLADVLDVTRGMPHVHWPKEVLFCLLEEDNFKALTCVTLPEIPALIEGYFFFEGLSYPGYAHDEAD